MNKLRHASSLVLVTKNGLIKNPVAKANDINVLSLKRSKKASHFPGSYVFPGGNCDPADENSEWLNLFPKSELDVQLNLMEKITDSSDDSVLPKAVSRRITAIRETFEECGILLCKHEANLTKSLATDYELKNKNFWRDKVRNNPVEFLNFCQAHNCFPNLKSLHLLSNWITPTPYSKRFNSIIFIAAIDHEVKGEPDRTEIEEVEWGSINHFLKDENVFLPPPQLYELMKLQNFMSFNVLFEYINKLDENICEAYLPVHVNVLDGFVMILPGDEKYEEFSNNPVENTIDLNCDIISFRGKVMNRTEYKFSNEPSLQAAKASVIIQDAVTTHLGDSSLHSKL